MKKLLLLIPIFLISCTKEIATAEITTENDSVIVSDGTFVESDSDSFANGKVILNDDDNSTETDPTFRVVQGGKITKTIDGNRLPLKISDEFTSSDQQYILQIKNFKGKKITGKIIPENPEMNIRFNQIKLPNGEFDGPFGVDLNFEIDRNGEIWLIVGKNLMASGASTGKFSIELK
ncbi:hypothetical protein [Kaistella yonginensis]|uniref:hypothetical protein n=1 Tax=Kaistella yonginensis TaxID=658267 RepID=UPI0025B53334|nr:hypothetical protein [Kaistella yonginensis]MDN3606575.1 hypothetical protein [Kaistella yonginensis]